MAEVVFAMKTGDLEPPLQMSLSGVSGDLNAVEGWRIVGRQGGEILFTDEDPTASIQSATLAIVSHSWGVGETDVPGPIEVEVVAIWPGGREQTFPPQGFSKVWIFESID